MAGEPREGCRTVDGGTKAKRETHDGACGKSGFRDRGSTSLTRLPVRRRTAYRPNGAVESAVVAAVAVERSRSTTEPSHIKIRRSRKAMVRPGETDEARRTYPLPDGVPKGRCKRRERRTTPALVSPTATRELIHKSNTTEGQEMRRASGRIGVTGRSTPSRAVTGPSDACAVLPKYIHPDLRPW